MTTPIFEMNNISWVRDGKKVLTNVNWKMNQGENWALFGLNGSGKTTLLNMLNGYIWPTTGEISVFGHKFGQIDLRELRKSIGWVSSSFQEKLHRSQKSQELVVSGKYATIGLYQSPTEEDYERADKLMRQLGVYHVKDRTYATCSQGEQQKLLIARALMASPKLLILDEAANGLDFISKEGLLDSIAELASSEQAPHLLYVTHHTEEILPIFTHTLLLRRGEVFGSGETKHIFNDEQLSQFFEMSVAVNWNDDRVWLRRK